MYAIFVHTSNFHLLWHSFLGVAIDPDQQRLDVTREGATAIGGLEHVQYVSCFAQDHVPPGGLTYDFIVLNHVIQHVPTETSPIILKHLCSLLAPEGIFVCSTTNCPEAAAGYEAHFSNTDMRLATECEFNNLAGNARSTALGVRWYSRPQLATLMRVAGFAELDWKGYTFNTPAAVESSNLHPLLKQGHDGKEELLATPISQAVACIKADRQIARSSM